MDESPQRHKECALLSCGVFVFFSWVLTIVGAIGISENESQIRNCGWFRRDVSEAHDWCLGGIIGGNFPERPERRNFNLYGNIWGACVEPTLGGVPTGPYTCNSWEEYINLANKLPMLSVPGDYCASNDQREPRFRSSLGTAACHAKDNYGVLAAFVIMGCIFTFAYSLTFCSRMKKDNFSMKMCSLFVGVLGWIWLVCAVAIYAGQNYPDEDRYRSSPICDEVEVRISFYLYVGWILELIAVIFVAPILIIHLCIPSGPYLRRKTYGPNYYS